MGFKAIDRARLIADEAKEIKNSVARSVSALQRDLIRVQAFAAFAFSSVVAADGDVDGADLAEIITQFQAQKTAIEALVPILLAVEAINDTAAPENIPANLAAFITDNGVDLASYVTRFK